jgi:hypothetical protein
VSPVAPTWLTALMPARCTWGPVRVVDGTSLRTWICEVDFPPYLGPRPDSLPLDCRKRSGLVAAADQTMSCAEVEVVRRLRAAGYTDAGWLGTCGQGTWGAFQRPRDRIRHELEALDPSHPLRVPTSGAGAPDVVSLGGPFPIFVECKGSEPLQVNQVDWIEAVLPDEQRRRSFAVVVRRNAGHPVRAIPVAQRRTGSMTAAAPQAHPELERMLLASDVAGNADRIDYRNPIAAFGVAAIQLLLNRIGQGQHPAFAVACLEAIGRSHPGEAKAALRQAADGNSDIRDLALAAITRLTRSGSSTSRPPVVRRSGVLEDVSTVGQPPKSQGPCQFLTKAGKPCQNPGRYWRDGRWSCSRNHAL